VGLLALQQELTHAGAAQPLDVLDAATEGMIGYILARELGNAAGGARPIATVLTQVQVDRDDPAFRNPTKFIGPLYEQAAAGRLAASRGWKMERDGEKWRRVVASPKPVGVVELETLKLLLAHGVTVICGGGGGIPVCRTQEGALAGVEAVIDKDLVSALLATELGADALLLLTDVDAVYRDWGAPGAAPIARMSLEEAAAMHLPAGSMGPKVDAARQFVEAGGRLAAIGRIGDAAAILSGEAGTVIARA